MKYLVLLVVLVIAFGVWRSRRAVPPQTAARPALPQAMVSCARCGVHIPRSEALTDGGPSYCSPEHQRQGPA
ncbi:PP0621 family protein [Paracidovorax valerianellae]|uniref:MYND finger n=1 Tax=Paracidovorax valerianellae TaxID=187868 RepID=A0A1G6PZN4_9BURK|nr:PP0621 family protein [Paracidovorax valerianellae]MDA8444513.1 hypothetical protein [Paracidovorax valerianellae]SDC85573.1 uncharacterized protein SAMN05192589_103387 [Paracidovorax valerianellae]